MGRSDVSGFVRAKRSLDAEHQNALASTKIKHPIWVLFAWEESGENRRIGVRASEAKPCRKATKRSRVHKSTNINKLAFNIKLFSVEKSFSLLKF